MAQPESIAELVDKAAAAPGPLVAKASREYRVKRLIIVAMLVVFGLWFGYDGFINWPNENARIKAIGTEIEAARKANDEAKVKALDAERSKLKEHSDTDLMFQKVLCFTLPPLGLAVLAWSLYNSRGAYRLQDERLHVPGHPPIPLDAIRSIDKTDWDRKGIAYVNYELVNGAKGAARLDDFIYDRVPTDAIFKRIEDYTGTGDTGAAAPTTA
jgi:hypothetical protein